VDHLSLDTLDEALNGKFADFPIPRLPRKKVADVVRSRGISILHYSVRQRSGLCSISFSSWNAVKQLMCGQPASTAQDLLWHVGWFFSSQSAPRLNWSGFMHDIINADKLCLPCADVRMWPIIDCNPNDLTCIYLTLRFISDQSAKLGIPTLCKGVRCPPIFSLSNLINAGWLVRKCVDIYIYIYIL